MTMDFEFARFLRWASIDENSVRHLIDNNFECLCGTSGFDSDTYCANWIKEMISH